MNQRTAAQGGYLSWSADLAIDCVQRRTRAMGITNYTQRNLKGEGRVVGGHVSPGCFVRTTAEFLIVCLEGVRFSRDLDPGTGFPELSIHPQD